MTSSNQSRKRKSQSPSHSNSQALIESKLAAQIGSGDHGQRLVPELLQSFGDKKRPLTESLLSLHHTVYFRVEPGQHRSMRRQRPTGGAECVLEDNRFRREAIEIRARVPVMAIDAKTIGPQTVDRDENNVGSWRLTGTGGQIQDQGTCQESDHGQCAAAGLPQF